MAPGMHASVLAAAGCMAAEATAAAAAPGDRWELRRLRGVAPRDVEGRGVAGTRRTWSQRRSRRHVRPVEEPCPAAAISFPVLLTPEVKALGLPNLSQVDDQQGVRAGAVVVGVCRRRRACAHPVKQTLVQVLCALYHDLLEAQQQDLERRVDEWMREDD